MTTISEEQLQKLVEGLRPAPRPTYGGSGAITVANVANSLSAGYSDTDACEDLGGAREQARFNMQMTALTSPAEYATKRSAALDEVKVATTAAFNAAYKTFHESGYSREEAKAMALRAAGVTKQVQEAAMNKRFGGTESVFMGAVARKNAPTHIASALPRKAAKKRGGRRKKA